MLKASSPTKILLINPGFEFIPIQSKYKGQFVFPFGLGYIASYLIKQGHSVDVWDIYIEQENYDKVREKINSGFLSNFDHIGITGIVNQYLYIKRLVGDIKAVSEAAVTIGGPIATYSYKILLENTKTDFCVIGYGELTYSDLIVSNNKREVKGITFLDSEDVIMTSVRESLSDLDSFPMPAFELFDMDFYIRHTGMMDVVRPWFKKKRVFSSRPLRIPCDLHVTTFFQRGAGSISENKSWAR